MNLTVDDFDSVITFADQSQWSTPDPQKNLPFDPTKSPWLDGTYHLTNIANASFSFDFEGESMADSVNIEEDPCSPSLEGPALFVYGASGPDYGSYEISLDGGSIILSAHASSNASIPHLLYSNSSLPYANHTLKVTNLGALNGDQGAGKFLFDYLLATTEIAPTGRVFLVFL